MTKEIDTTTGGGMLPDSDDMYIKALFSVLSAEQKAQFISRAACSLEEQSTPSSARVLRDVANL